MGSFNTLILPSSLQMLCWPAVGAGKGVQHQRLKCSELNGGNHREPKGAGATHHCFVQEDMGGNGLEHVVC